MSLGTNGAHGAIDVLSNFLVLPVEGPAQCLSARGSPTPFVEHFRFTHLKGSFIIQSIVHPFSLKFNLIFHCTFIIASKNENVRIKYCKNDVKCTWNGHLILERKYRFDCRHRSVQFMIETEQLVVGLIDGRLVVTEEIANRRSLKTRQTLL